MKRFKFSGLCGTSLVRWAVVVLLAASTVLGTSPAWAGGCCGGSAEADGVNVRFHFMMCVDGTGKGNLQGRNIDDGANPAGPEEIASMAASGTINNYASDTAYETLVVDEEYTLSTSISGGTIYTTHIGITAPKGYHVEIDKIKTSEINKTDERAVRTGQASASEIQGRSKLAGSLASAIDGQQELMRQGAAHAMRGAPHKLGGWERAASLKSSSELRYLPYMDESRLTQLRSEANARGKNVEQVLSYSEQRALKELRAQVRLRIKEVAAAEAVALPNPFARGELLDEQPPTRRGE